MSLTGHKLSQNRASQPGLQLRILIALLLLYTVARVLQDFPTRVHTLLIVALHVLPPAAFALLHGMP
jgi:hypothetical protein